MKEFKLVVESLKDDVIGFNIALLGLNEKNVRHKRKIAAINDLISEYNAAIKKLES